MNKHKDNEINKMCFDFASVIACDIADEVLELCRNNKDTSRYNSRLSDYINNDPDTTFYISDPIDRYVQADDTDVEKKDGCNVLLYADELPVCLITTDYNIDNNQRLSYNCYSVNDDRFSDIVSSEGFYLLNASDYGFYLINDNDYYMISYPISENKNFLNDVKKLNIYTNKISKNALDPGLLDRIAFNIHVKDYNYDLDKGILSDIYNCLKDSEPEYKDCELVGPVPVYQYYFTDINNIEVCDFNMENESYYFKLVRDSKVIGYLSYDSFDDEIQIYEGLNEADKKEKDCNAYYVNLADVAYIFPDDAVDENPEEPSYLHIDKKVIDAIQNKLYRKGSNL